MDIKTIQTEVDAAYLYSKLAENEVEPSVAAIFQEMSEIENSHAVVFSKKYDLPNDFQFKPSIRAKTLNWIGKVFGYDTVLGVLMNTEKSISNGVLMNKTKMKLPLTGMETNHVKILQTLLENNSDKYSSQIARFEKRHRNIGGNAIRAAVLGGNDGLVSNFCLIMGVAGAGADSKTVLLTGVAGLLAGALSMSLGEWISVKSSQELYENQMELEMEELESNPEGELREIKLFYKAKGIDDQKAMELARNLMQDKQKAHAFLVKEELGISPDDLKDSAIEAAIYSFVLFAIGAILPLAPFFFLSGIQAIIVTSLVSALGLFLIGAAITLFTGRSLWSSGFRQVLFGMASALLTFGIGRLIGVSVAG